MANIISFLLKKKEYESKECQHNNIVVDESQWLVECADCGTQLDPIWYLCYLAKEENKIEYRVNQLKEELMNIRAKIKIRTRTKCEHCGQITKIKGV